MFRGHPYPTWPILTHNTRLTRYHVRPIWMNAQFFRNKHQDSKDTAQKELSNDSPFHMNMKQVFLDNVQQGLSRLS